MSILRYYKFMSWTEDSRDIVAQNFLVKTPWTGKQVLIYPQAKTLAYGLTETCFKPHNNQGWWANLFDLVCNPGIVASYYTVCGSSISVGDQINVFGLLRLDEDSNILFMDKPLAYFSGRLQEGLDAFKTALWTDQLKSVASMVWHSMLAMGCLAAIYECGWRLKRNLRAQRNQQLAQALQEMDKQNAIADQPELIRVPPENLTQIKIASYKCIKCKIQARSVINFDCMHCSVCWDCYQEKVKDKFICNICEGPVEKICRIYVS